MGRTAKRMGEESLERTPSGLGRRLQELDEIERFALVLIGLGVIMVAWVSLLSPPASRAPT